MTLPLSQEPPECRATTTIPEGPIRMNSTLQLRDVPTYRTPNRKSTVRKTLVGVEPSN